MILAPLDQIQVIGSTPLLTDWGYRKAEDLAKVPQQKNKVWDGQKFQSIQIKSLEPEYPLVRVYFSNGAHLDCGGQHQFQIETNEETKLIKAIDLEPEMKLPKFQLPEVFTDIHLPLMSSFIDRMGTFLRTRLDGFKEVVFPCHIRKEQTAENILGQMHQMLHYLTVDSTFSSFIEADEPESQRKPWADEPGEVSDPEVDAFWSGKRDSSYQYKQGPDGNEDVGWHPEREPKKCLVISPSALQKLIEMGMETPQLKVPDQNVEPMKWIELTILGIEILQEKADLYGLTLKR